MSSANRKSACKISRRLGVDLALKGLGRDISSKCKLTTPPGQHGAKKGRSTDYGVQLKHKQQIKEYYRLKEKQFRSYFKEAARRAGATGELLLELLESRLDNVVYRMGFASTRAEARQLVTHKAIEIKGANEDQATKVNVPSYVVKKGDVISVCEKAKSQLRIKDAMRMAANVGFAEWLQVDTDGLVGTFQRTPDRSELPAEFNEQSVVELYSK